CLLLQTGFSGRAEIGLAGDDRLHLKVSADGSTWVDALVADPVALDISCGGPLRLAAFPSDALPPVPAAGALIYLSDLATVAFSDGQAWRRIDGGAAIKA